MRKLFNITLAALLTILTSCSQEELDLNSAGRYCYRFSAVNPEVSKVNVGGFANRKWSMLWENGDRIGVYMDDGTFVGVATMDNSSAGKGTGLFTVQSDVELTAGDMLYFSYPYIENAAIRSGKIDAHQFSASSEGVADHAIAYAQAEYVPDETEFTLTYANAYLKVNVASSQFQGYTLNGITLWASGAKLSGEATVASNGSVTPSEYADDYVKAMLPEPVVMGTSTQPVWLASLPVEDLREHDVYLIAHLSKGIETVTLPMLIREATGLQAGVVTSVNLPDISTRFCPSWYEPVETRYVAAGGDGWCYGSDNTVIFNDMTVPQTVDLKPRGNFRMVRQPKYVRIKYLNGLNDCTDPKGVQINGIQATTYASGNGEESFTPVEVDNTCSVSVVLDNHKYLSKELGSVGYISAMEVLDKDMNVIWGINLWLTLKPITTVQYDNGVVMDRNLGVDETGAVSSFRSSGNYFQWGRPWAMQSQESVYTRKYFTSGVHTEVTSLAVSAANPYKLYYYYMSGSNPNSSGEDLSGDDLNLNKDWYYGDGTTSRTNDLDDLWGNPNGNGQQYSGVKSIYDPCPKGWRVPHPALLKEVQENHTFVTDSRSIPSLFYRESHWTFTGCYTCDGWNKGFNWKEQEEYCTYWSNSNVNGSGTAVCLYGRYVEEEGVKELELTSTYSKARAMAIRCMVDTENR